VSPNSLSYLLTFGFLALFVTGCGGDTSKPSNSASPSPSTSAAASASPVASASSAPSFTQPVVAGANPSVSPAPEVAVKSESMAAALLPASNSDTIVRNTAKGRTDPFANVVFQSVVETTSTPNRTTRIAAASSRVTPATGGSFNPNPTAAGGSRVGSGLGLASAAANAGKGKAPGNDAAVAIRPRAIPSGALDSGPRPGRPPLVPVDPNQVAIRTIPQPSASTAPQPAYASNISVSGVAQVNGQTQVILKLPNESFSRYVSVGERVMDGRVLVKRVENPNATTPVVVLEEVGTEIPRKVGEKLTAPAKDGVR
jgi:hypothetical protein